MHAVIFQKIKLLTEFSKIFLHDILARREEAKFLSQVFHLYHCVFCTTVFFSGSCMPCDISQPLPRNQHKEFEQLYFDFSGQFRGSLIHEGIFDLTWNLGHRPEKESPAQPCVSTALEKIRALPEHYITEVREKFLRGELAHIFPTTPTEGSHAAFQEQRDNCIRACFKLLLTGEIPLQSFGTLSMLYSAASELGVVRITQEYPYDTHGLPSEAFSRFLCRKDVSTNPRIQSLWGKLPRAEQFLFFAERDTPLPKDRLHSKAMNLIAAPYVMPWNFFHPTSLTYTLPSLGILQSLFVAYRGAHALELAPRFGRAALDPEFWELCRKGNQFLRFPTLIFLPLIGHISMR